MEPITLPTDLAARLAAPFPPDAVEWRPVGAAKAGQRCQVAAYLDARAVAARLDEVCGPLGWAFDWQPVAVEGGEVRIARGVLTIGGIAKADVGTASTFEPSKGAVSDALKRAAVLWGVGRYLYELGRVTVQLDAGGRIPGETLAKLQAGLARRAGKGAA